MCNEAVFKILCLFIFYQHVVKYEYTPESNYIKNIAQATSLHFTEEKKKRPVIALDGIQEVIAFLLPDNCAILHNQYSGDGILLIGKMLQ